MKTVIGWLSHGGKSQLIHGGLKSKEAKLLSKSGSLVRVTGNCDRRSLGKIRRFERILFKGGVKL